MFCRKARMRLGDARTIGFHTSWVRGLGRSKLRYAQAALRASAAGRARGFLVKAAGLCDNDCASGDWRSGSAGPLQGQGRGFKSLIAHHPHTSRSVANSARPAFLFWRPFPHRRPLRNAPHNSAASEPSRRTPARRQPRARPRPRGKSPPRARESRATAGCCARTDAWRRPLRADRSAARRAPRVPGRC